MAVLGAEEAKDFLFNFFWVGIGRSAVAIAVN